MVCQSLNKTNVRQEDSNGEENHNDLNDIFACYFIQEKFTRGVNICLWVLILIYHDFLRRQIETCWKTFYITRQYKLQMYDVRRIKPSAC